MNVFTTGLPFAAPEGFSVSMTSIPLGSSAEGQDPISQQSLPVWKGMGVEGVKDDPSDIELDCWADDGGTAGGEVRRW